MRGRVIAAEIPIEEEQERQQQEIGSKELTKIPKLQVTTTATANITGKKDFEKKYFDLLLMHEALREKHSRLVRLLLDAIESQWFIGIEIDPSILNTIILFSHQFNPNKNSEY